MKHLKIALLALFVVASFSNVNAQDSNNPWAIGFGINAVDFYPTGFDAPGIGTFASQFANANGHYNIIPSLSRVTAARHIIGGFSGEVAGSLNKIDKVGENSIAEETYYGLDGAIKYSFLHKNASWFDPFLGVGGGMTWVGDQAAATVNGTIGANVWVSEHLGFNIQTSYKHTFNDIRLYPHFQHAAGIVIRFGGVDTDGDGVYDKDDACPEVFGLKEFNGCPDTDGDGIIDSEDACPDDAGTVEMNGCPDTDGDGVADNVDGCPSVAGPAENKGCPWADTDGDSVLDKDDKCPNEVGPAANNGCPWIDTDGDGVLDKDDNCPDTVGTADNNGCPALPKEAKEQLAEYSKGLTFDTGKSTIKSEPSKILNKIAEILNEYPKASFNVNGYTDNTGTEKINENLSKDRADAVVNYLTAHGVEASRLESNGFAASKPVASNDTAEGRQQNRRAEVVEKL